MIASRTTAFFSLLLTSLAAAAEADKIQFKYLPARGESQKYQTVRTETSTRNIGGTEVTTRESVTMDQTIVITGVNDNRLALSRVTFDRAAIDRTTTTDGRTTRVQFDSAKPVDPIPPELRDTAAIVGKVMRVKVDNRSQAIEVDSDELADAMWSQMSPAQDATEQRRSEFRKQINEAMRLGTNDVFSILPDKPIAVGQTWVLQSEAIVASLVRVRIESRLTLKEFKDRIGRFEFTSTITPAPMVRQDWLPASDPKLQVKASGTRRGTVEMTVNGWLRSGEMQEDLALELFKPGQQDQPVIKLTQQATTKVTQGQ